MSKSAIRDYVIALVAKFPKAPALTLAKKAYREHPEYWASLERCRCHIRYYLGVSGVANRESARNTHSHFIRPARKAGWHDVIPEELVQLPDWKAFVIDGAHKALIISDIHVPFHDSAALEVALEIGRKRKVSLIILDGDIADHYAISDYMRDPALRDFAGEIKAIRQLLAGLRRRFGKQCRIIYKHGNHEERFERYMRMKAPELLGVPEFSWESIFGLEEYGIELVGHKRPIRLGKLNVIHGHEYVFQISNPVNPARGFFMRAKTHVIGGHFHQTSNHSEKNLEQTVISTWSLGALCNLHPEYRPLNNWNHGFAFVETDKTGTFHVENLRVINGKVY